METCLLIGWMFARQASPTRRSGSGVGIQAISDLLTDALVLVSDCRASPVVGLALVVVLVDLSSGLEGIRLDCSTELVGGALPVTVRGVSGVIVSDAVVRVRAAARRNEVFDLLSDRFVTFRRAQVVVFAFRIVSGNLRIALHRVGDDSSPSGVKRTLAANVSNMTLSIVAWCNCVDNLLRCGLVTFRLYVAGQLVGLASKLITLLFSPQLLCFGLDGGLELVHGILSEVVCHC